jgi:hypothetical protein
VVPVGPRVLPIVVFSEGNERFNPVNGPLLLLPVVGKLHSQQAMCLLVNYLPARIRLRNNHIL